MTVIVDEDLLYRRLSIGNCFKQNGKISSVVFKRRGEPDHEISVDLARLTTAQESVDRPGRLGFVLAQMEARSPRSLGFTVVHDPQDDNQSHSLILGENNSQRCRALADMLEIVEGVESKAA